jgi:hypothetical protein
MKYVRLMVAAIFVIGLMVIYRTRTQEPSYHGRTLTDWLQTGQNGRRLGPSSPHYYPFVSSAVVPVQAIGTNGIPTLLSLIRTQDSKVKHFILTLSERHTWIKLPLLPDWEKQNMAVRGFMILGTNAISAAPELIQIIHEGNGDAPFAATYILFSVLKSVYLLGDGSRNLSLSILQELLHDSDRDVQLNAANCLRVWFPEEADKTGLYKRFPQLKAPSTNNLENDLNLKKS